MALLVFDLCALITFGVPHCLTHSTTAGPKAQLFGGYGTPANTAEHTLDDESAWAKSQLWLPEAFTRFAGSRGTGL